MRTRMPAEHVRNRLAATAAVLVAALAFLGGPEAARAEDAGAGDLGTDRDAFTPNTHTIKPASTTASAPRGAW